jgi:hypothetical protein
VLAAAARVVGEGIAPRRGVEGLERERLGHGSPPARVGTRGIDGFAPPGYSAFAASSSTSKTRALCGGIRLPAPRSP